MPATHFAERNGSRVLALILAVCLSTAGVWAYVFLNHERPVATGEILALQAVPTHFELRQGGTGGPDDQGVVGGTEKQDELLLLVEATVRDVARFPVFPHEQTAVLTLARGDQAEVQARSPRELADAVRAFPALAKAARTMGYGAGAGAGAVLPREGVLQPGGSATGLLLFALPLTQAEWNTRRSLAVEIALRNQRTLALPEPAHAAGSR